MSGTDPWPLQEPTMPAAPWWRNPNHIAPAFAGCYLILAVTIALVFIVTALVTREWGLMLTATLALCIGPLLAMIVATVADDFVRDRNEGER